MPTKAMIAAALRFKEAWETGMRRGGEGVDLSDLDIIEMHEAALGLIWATGTDDLQSALTVLHEFDA